MARRRRATGPGALWRALVWAAGVWLRVGLWFVGWFVALWLIVMFSRHVLDIG